MYRWISENFRTFLWALALSIAVWIAAVMFGKTVRTLVEKVQEAGTYTIPVNAAELDLSSGAYLYRIEAVGTTDTYVKVNKMIFAR